MDKISYYPIEARINDALLTLSSKLKNKTDKEIEELRDLLTEYLEKPKPIIDKVTCTVLNTNIIQDKEEPIKIDIRVCYKDSEVYGIQLVLSQSTLSKTEEALPYAKWYL